MIIGGISLSWFRRACILREVTRLPGYHCPPSSQKLVFASGEPTSLDPAKSTNTWEVYVIPALFEGLTQPHPEQPDPIAALATHYQSSRDQTRFTFYLRGHRSLAVCDFPAMKTFPDGLPPATLVQSPNLLDGAMVV